MKDFIGYTALAIVGLGIILGIMFGLPSFNRYQARQEAQNQVSINEIRIKQQEQLIQVEIQKAEI